MLDKTSTDDAKGALLRAWIENLGGNLASGACRLKSVKVSKGGKKLTLVLKKKKPRG